MKSRLLITAVVMIVLLTTCEDQTSSELLNAGKVKLKYGERILVPSPQMNVEIPSALTYPNGGENIQQFHRAPIKWQSAAFPAGYMRIEYYCGGVFSHVITEATWNDGEYNDYPFQTLCSDAKVKISALFPSTDFDYSDATFGVVNSTHSSVGVIAPNGYENWSCAINPYPYVKWRPSFYGKLANVKIELLAYAGGNWNVFMVLESSTPNDGVQQISYTSCGGYYSLYKVRISKVGGGPVDESDHGFYEIGYQTPVSVYKPEELRPMSAGLYQVQWNTNLFTYSDLTLVMYNNGVQQGDPVYSSNDGSEYMSFQSGGCQKVKIYQTVLGPDRDYSWSDYCVYPN
jgi:hypothetical protein